MLRRLFKRSKPENPQLSRYIRKNLGFTPNTFPVYEQAFRHSSVAVKEDSGIKNSNERLEYLGDAILDAIVANYLYFNFPDEPEGNLTKMKAKIVSRRNLNSMGRALDIPSQLDMDLGGQEVHQSIIGNAFEALVGAVYLDKGFDFTEKVMIKLLTNHGLDKKVHIDVDFKSKLHEWCQKEKKTLRFNVLAEEQEGGSSHYEVAVAVEGQELGRGSGKSKKSAEQLAAKEACRELFSE